MIVEKNKVGSITIADVYAQQVKLGNAELDLIKAKNDLETLKSNFLYNLGLDVLDNYDFKDVQTEVDSAEIKKLNLQLETDIRSMVQQALENRADYQSLKLNLQSTYNSLTIANSGHIPSLIGTSSFNVNSQQVNTLFDNRSYYVALTLDIPIFSGFSVEDKVELAKVDIKNKQIDLNDFERDVKRNIQKNYLDIQTSEKRLEVSRQNVTAAEENRKIEEEKYELGSTTLLDVLIANSDYTNALTDFINAQFEFIKLKEQLNYLLGVLDYKKFE
jgi:outer membrane protein